MSRHTIYTYKNNEEYERRYKELEEQGEEIYNFESDSTDELLANDPEITIDISALISAVSQNLGAIQNGIYNLRYLDEHSQVIVKSDLADLAISYFYMLFDEVEPLYDDEEEETEENNIIPFKRKILYTYQNNSQLDKIIDLVNKNEIPFTNFVKYNGIDNKNFNLVSSSKKDAIVDITSLTNVVVKNPENIFIFEQAMQYLPYYNAIVSDNMVDKALESFNFLFSSKKPITELLNDLEFDVTESNNQPEEKKIIKVRDLESVDLISSALSNQLVGHKEFKRKFKECLDNFMILNRVGARKIFSVFLLGNSGLGKTEVARIIQRTLNNDTSLVKINFGNYSSDNALNSLIGSPRGYIGSETGELSLKIDKSKAGIILCDEFEKATFAVYNFFLELLEDGVFTDSQAVEYVLDGYIIIFTSNITEYQFYESIPNTLQSRIDFVSDFKELTKEEKIGYVNYQIKTFLRTLDANDDLPEFSDEDYEYFKGINIDSTNNLRDIQRIVQNRVLNKLKEYLNED